MNENVARRNATSFDKFEENVIGTLLGLMTLITFANVVARYVFNSNILWGLEATVFLFAWLVLFGASYCVKHSVHIGVDIFINSLSKKNKRFVALCAVGACLVFSILLLIGSWNYWYPFVTSRAFYETDDIPMPDFLQFFAHWLNDGELYEKLPRFIPYSILPIAMALMTYRFFEIGLEVWQGKRDSIIASHEAEELMDEVLSKNNMNDASDAKDIK